MIRGAVPTASRTVDMPLVNWSGSHEKQGARDLSIARPWHVRISG